MKRERIFQYILIALISIVVFSLTSCASNYQSCAAYDYHTAK